VHVLLFFVVVEDQGEQIYGKEKKLGKKSDGQADRSSKHLII